MLFCFWQLIYKTGVFMKNKFLIALIGIYLVSFSAQARLAKASEEQGNQYISRLSQLGKDQLNYKEFKAAIEHLKKQGYVMDSSRMDFYGENVQQIKENEQQVRNWLEFAIQVNFSDKIVVRDGVKYHRIPTLKARGIAQEICGKGLQTCDPASEVEFTGYEISWGEVPDLGGGTSSAGSK